MPYPGPGQATVPWPYTLDSTCGVAEMDIGRLGTTRLANHGSNFTQKISTIPKYCRLENLLILIRSGNLGHLKLLKLHVV